MAVCGPSGDARAGARGPHTAGTSTGRRASAPTGRVPGAPLGGRSCPSTGASPLPAVPAGLEGQERPLAEGEAGDEPARAEVVGPHTLGDRYRDVVHDPPGAVVGRLQDDL